MTQTEAAKIPVRPTIVVGVDGSHANLGALLWAADEARRIGADVQLVSAIVQELRNHADMLFSGPVIDKEIQASLTAAQRLVREALPGQGEIDTQMIVGHAAKVLAKSSRHAARLVMGRRGRGTFGRLLLGSVSAAGASRSEVPAVVVPSSWDPNAHRTEAVVVGVDGTRRSDDAIRFAFDMAQRRSVPLKAVHVSNIDELLMWAPPDLVVQPLWRKAANETLERSLAAWQDTYPGVAVTRAVRNGHPVEVLIDDAIDAQALVVGGHPHRRPAGAMLGSVALGVLAHAQRPVVVVHERRAGRA
jgi:nucleotide-binding universal stress UspA family protein